MGSCPMNPRYVLSAIYAATADINKHEKRKMNDYYPVLI